MIHINNFQISSDSNSIDVSVKTDLNYNITSAKFFTNETFGNDLEAIDLTYKLEQVTNEENFVINSSDVDLTDFSGGIYFMEFESNSDVVAPDECSSCDNSLGVAASLIKYQECKLNKVLELSVCDFDIESICNTSEFNSIINIELIISSLKTAIEFGYYDEAFDLLSTLDKLCKGSSCTGCGCSECKELPNVVNTTGLCYGTLDNTFNLL